MVLEPSWVARMSAIQEDADKVRKYLDIDASINNDEFEFRTVEELHILYQNFDQCAQLILLIDS